MSTYDVAVIIAALLVALGLLLGAKELTHEIRRRLRRWRVRSEMAPLPHRETRVSQGSQRRPAVPALHPLPAPDTGRPVRDEVIGIDQMLLERRAKFLQHLDDRGLCLDELHIEPKDVA